MHYIHYLPFKTYGSRETSTHECNNVESHEISSEHLLIYSTWAESAFHICKRPWRKIIEIIWRTRPWNQKENEQQKQNMTRNEKASTASLEECHIWHINIFIYVFRNVDRKSYWTAEICPKLYNTHCSTEYSYSCPIQMITASFTKGRCWIHTSIRAGTHSANQKILDMVISYEIVDHSY